TTAAPGRRQAASDQWFQWLAFRADGQVAIAYYDRQFGSDEMTGASDYSLAGSRDLRSFAVRRVTSSSSPPPTQFGGTFWGDYAALAVHDQALPLWSDTRAPNLFLCPGSSTGPGNPPRLCGRQDANGAANDEDVFAAGLGVPG
ncbi:MAG TPA: exo-alpha-sialidase, partial [Candidatus Dormibacteraeota bacterium]|nr:exo-alpha-sialidase [Candidatus Dormibacteraeota bacterium]